MNATAAGIEVHDLRAFLGLNHSANAGFESIRVDVHLVSSASDDELVDLHRRFVSTSPVGQRL